MLHTVEDMVSGDSIVVLLRREFDRRSSRFRRLQPAWLAIDRGGPDSRNRAARDDLDRAKMRLEDGRDGRVERV